MSSRKRSVPWWLHPWRHRVPARLPAAQQLARQWRPSDISQRDSSPCNPWVSHHGPALHCGVHGALRVMHHAQKGTRLVRGSLNLLEQRVDLAVDARIVRRVCACSHMGSCRQPRGVQLNMHVSLESPHRVSKATCATHEITKCSASGCSIRQTVAIWHFYMPLTPGVDETCTPPALCACRNL
jgi:hypothetical protein